MTLLFVNSRLHLPITFSCTARGLNVRAEKCGPDFRDVKTDSQCVDLRDMSNAFEFISVTACFRKH